MKRPWSSLAADLDELCKEASSTLLDYDLPAGQDSASSAGAPALPTLLAPSLAAAEEQEPLAWVHRLHEGYSEVIDKLGPQTSDFILVSACTGTGAAFIGLQAWLCFARTSDMHSDTHQSSDLEWLWGGFSCWARALPNTLVVEYFSMSSPFCKRGGCSLYCNDLP